MRMLATGQNCLPAKGIGAVSTQLCDNLAPERVRLNAKVETVGKRGDDMTRILSLASGELITAKKSIIVACEGPEAVNLLGHSMKASPSKNEPAVGTTCLYFAMDTAPTNDAILYLDGENKGGIVNNCCFPSNVASSYAPAGKALASVSLIGVPDQDDASIEACVRKELSSWLDQTMLQPGACYVSTAFRTRSLIRNLQQTFSDRVSLMMAYTLLAIIAAQLLDGALCGRRRSCGCCVLLRR